VSGRHPTPWRIERRGNDATVYDAAGEPVSLLTDMPLGWTDTSTGSYHDPEADYEIVERIVVAVNARSAGARP
jgi:hypothetical protein